MGRCEEEDELRYRRARSGARTLVQYVAEAYNFDDDEDPALVHMVQYLLNCEAIYFDAHTGAIFELQNDTTLWQMMDAAYDWATEEDEDIVECDECGYLHLPDMPCRCV